MSADNHIFGIAEHINKCNKLQGGSTNCVGWSIALTNYWVPQKSSWTVH